MTDTERVESLDSIIAGLKGMALYDRLSAALERERAEVLKVAEEVEGIRALYGELVPFDPNIGGFDVALQRDGQRKAVCRMMNAILNGEWAAALRRAVGKKEGEGE